MVGLVLDGRESGPGARAYAEDVARWLARDGIQTHLLVLVPTPSAPRILHSICRGDSWLQRDGAHPGDEAIRAALQTKESPEDVAALADEVAHLVEREGIGMLHAIGSPLAVDVTHAAHERTRTPYLVTPRGEDWARTDAAFQTAARRTLGDARHVLVFDEDVRHALAARFEPRPGEPHPHARVVQRGVDLELFQPLARGERRRVADAIATRPALGARLDGVDWEHACVVLCVEPRAGRYGFEQFLFAMPELVRQQPALQVVVATTGRDHERTDQLRAALASGRAETLHDVLQTSELYQPLLDHLACIHNENRAESWWSTAARLEPERRLRYTGPVERREFAQLLRLADLVVMPGTAPRPTSQIPYEALACGVLSVASESAGLGPLVRLITSEVSAEIAALCALRPSAQPVREMEEKVGRILRLRPELAGRLRALAEKQFDGRQAATALRRMYGEPARVAALRP
jgi:glycosyltransferase involved in cell wall biosynthesis